MSHHEAFTANTLLFHSTKLLTFCKRLKAVRQLLGSSSKQMKVHGEGGNEWDCHN